MRTKERYGVLVVGHGSRRQEANDDVRQAAYMIGERGSFPLVEAAFLEIEQPNIAAGYKRLVERGSHSITVHPYFLSPGRHTRGDLPREVHAVAADYPEVTFAISEPLNAHPLVIEAAVERIRESNRRDRCGAGSVFLVGAGPGDPGLLTIKALNLLKEADVFVYDYLVNPELLVNVRRDAERLYVGKIGGGRQTPQREINRMLIAAARAGNMVVRLKGGDPCLFGRGGEEAQALSQAGVPYQIVPGVSSALAVPTYAGIPLTYRGVSSSVAFVTGAQAEDGALPPSLGQLSGADTIVILMGMAHLRRITEELIASGRSSQTPVAAIRWGTYEGQRTLTGTLGSIAERVEQESFRAPAVIVVGEVVRLRDKLQWFENSLPTLAGSINELETTIDA